VVHGLRIRDKYWFLLETRKDKRKSKKVLGIVLLLQLRWLVDSLSLARSKDVNSWRLENPQRRANIRNNRGLER
jgi:hypothetical protein